jgi:hypothetical protein
VDAMSLGGGWVAGRGLGGRVGVAAAVAVVVAVAGGRAGRGGAAA